jgi:hypothetical protein
MSELRTFEINGEAYEVPLFDELTLDEERVLYVYADSVVADFVPPHPEEDDKIAKAILLEQARKIRNPEFKRALAHIAYKRRHPDAADADIQKALGRVNAFDLDLAILRGDADDPPTTTSRKQPENKSGSKPPSSAEASGRDSENTSGIQAVSLARTGTTASDTSFPPLLATASDS